MDKVVFGNFVWCVWQLWVMCGNFGKQHGWGFEVETARLEFMQIVKDEKPHDIVMSLPDEKLSTKVGKIIKNICSMNMMSHVWSWLLK